MRFNRQEGNVTMYHRVTVAYEVGTPRENHRDRQTDLS